MLKSRADASAFAAALDCVPAIAGQGRIRVLVFSTLYPSLVRPRHGVFVETRLRQVMRSGNIEARVVAPVPWFPSRNPRFGSYADFARTPQHEDRAGLSVFHPRYLLPPKVGMNMAPLALALGARRTVAGLIRDGFDFDLIDAHYFYPDGVAAALLSKWFGRPLVITARGSDLNVLAQHALPLRQMKWAARQAGANVAVSHALAQVLMGWGTDPDRIHVLRNGVDTEHFEALDRYEARSRLGLRGGPFLASVGNLVDLKRHDIAIRTLAAVSAEYPHAQLLLLGDGPRRQELQALATALNLTERVHFCGVQPQSQLSIWYSAADVLLLPSEREGMPNVVLEAMACATPVVAFNVGGVPDVVTGPGVGILVNAHDEGAFAVAVLQLLTAPPLRQPIRAYAKTLDWLPTASALLTLFERLARARSPAA